jgi:quinol monooxygenase YgiN
LFPRDESDENSLYVIEEYGAMNISYFRPADTGIHGRYKNQAALDAHMNAEPTKAALAFVSRTDPPVLTGPPSVKYLEVFDDLASIKPQIREEEDPYIVAAELVYKPGMVAESMKYWKAVAATSKNDEPGTLAYALAKDTAASQPPDPRVADNLVTVEVYTSKDYLWETHVKSQAVQDNINHTKDMREGLKHHALKNKAGYWYK